MPDFPLRQTASLKDHQRDGVIAVVICGMFLLVAFSIMNFVNSSSAGPPSVTPSSADTPTVTAPVASQPPLVQTPRTARPSIPTVTVPVASQPAEFSGSEFQEVLDSIQTKTGSTHEIIERLLIFNQEELEKKGQTESLLELAHHIDDSMAPGEKYSAVQVFAIYTVMRTTPLK